MLTEKELTLRIKIVRNYLGMTQDDFGRQLGLTEYAVAQIEKGNRPLTINMINILESCGINRNYFFDQKARVKY